MNITEIVVEILWDDCQICLRHVLPLMANKKEIEWELCRLTFQGFAEQSNIHPPWGVLTGVRPVGIYHQQKAKGKTDKEIFHIYRKKYQVLPEKAKLAVTTALKQQPLRDMVDHKSYSLYISIPFCPTRCHYCSFISQGISSAEKLVPDYLELLHLELQYISKLTEELGLSLQSIYVGGGTPTTLSAKQLEELLGVLENNFLTDNLKEYTVEAGRPDTITKEKLNVLKTYGVKRISINPQTLNSQVLDSIGRGHSVEEFFKAYELAKTFDFTVINTDFIAGLPGETNKSFLHGIHKILSMSPENITIHTLTLKKSSEFREKSNLFQKEENLTELLSQCNKILDSKGYHPYYIYRQKRTRQNQENTGYSLKNKESFYNVAMMEDIQTIIGAGAGGTTKFVPQSGKIERIYNYKYPFEYIQNFKEILHRKEKVRKFYEGN